MSRLAPPRTLTGWALGLALVLAPAAAHADDAAAAKGLFDTGLAMMKAGNYPAACTALADSYQLNPLPGALFTLADCEAKRGRLASAVKRYAEYLGVYAALPKDKQAKQHGREAHSRAQITLLAPQVPRVVLALPAGAPEDLALTLDGAPLDRAALGAPMQVDPGEHVIGAQGQEQRFSVEKGEQRTVAIELKAAPAPPPGEPKAAGMRPLRVAGFVALSTGAAALGVFAITGALVLSKKGVIRDNCTLDDAKGVAVCNPKGFDAGHAVGPLGAASTVTLIAGLALAGAGVGMIVGGGGDPPSQGRAAPRAQVAVLRAGPEGLVVGLTGAF